MSVKKLWQTYFLKFEIFQLDKFDYMMQTGEDKARCLPIRLSNIVSIKFYISYVAAYFDALYIIINGINWKPNQTLKKGGWGGASYCKTVTMKYFKTKSS